MTLVMMLVEVLGVVEEELVKLLRLGLCQHNISSSSFLDLSVIYLF